MTDFLVLVGGGSEMLEVFLSTQMPTLFYIIVIYHGPFNCAGGRLECDVMGIFNYHAYAIYLVIDVDLCIFLHISA